jgi:HEAT repeat protein
MPVFTDDDALRLMTLGLAHPDAALSLICTQVLESATSTPLALLRRLELADDVDPWRLAAGLLEFARHDLVEWVVGLTEHPTPRVRSAALWALGDIEDPRVLPVVRRATSDPSEVVP